MKLEFVKPHIFSRKSELYNDRNELIGTTSSGFFGMPINIDDKLNGIQAVLNLKGMKRHILITQDDQKLGQFVQEELLNRYNGTLLLGTESFIFRKKNQRIKIIHTFSDRLVGMIKIPIFIGKYKLEMLEFEHFSIYFVAILLAIRMKNSQN